MLEQENQKRTEDLSAKVNRLKHVIKYWNF